MSFTDLNKIDGRTVSFTLKNTHVSYANTLRRLILTSVETVGFRADMTPTGSTSDVRVHHNDTAMTNEMLAHRIGLLPIQVKEPMKWNPDRYEFKLDVINDTDGVRDVVAADFKVYERGADSTMTEIPSNKFFVPDPLTGDTCLIATLPRGEKQRISISARATLGNGREHARFIPVSQCSYKYTRDTNPERLKSMFREWLLHSKKVQLSDLPEGNELHEAFQREFNTMEVDRCFLKDAHDEPISFDFVLETAGVLDILYIVQRACNLGEAMAGRFATISSGELLPELSIGPSEGRIIGFDFLFKGHDHTLGNILQTWLVQNHIEGTSLPRITYAGYKIPHPLYDEMVLTIGVQDGQETTARTAVSVACNGIVNMFRNFYTSWNQINGIVPTKFPKTVAIRRPASARPTVVSEPRK